MFEIFKEDIRLLLKFLTIILICSLLLFDLIFVINYFFDSLVPILDISIINFKQLLTLNVFIVMPSYIYILYIRSICRIENCVEPNRIGF